MKTAVVGLLAVGALTWAVQARSQQAEVLRDLESKDPHPLTIDEVKALMPGAKVSRVGRSGTTVYWVDEEGGSMIVNSDNKGYGNVRPSTARGKWNITDDGRYCVLIEFNRAEPEQWCRFLIKTSEGYYGTTSTAVGTAKVYKIEISK